MSFPISFPESPPRDTQCKCQFWLHLEQSISQSPPLLRLQGHVSLFLCVGGRSGSTFSMSMGSSAGVSSVLAVAPGSSFFFCTATLDNLIDLGVAGFGSASFPGCILLLLLLLRSLPPLLLFLVIVLLNLLGFSSVENRSWENKPGRRMS